MHGPGSNPGSTLPQGSRATGKRACKSKRRSAVGRGAVERRVRISTQELRTSTKANRTVERAFSDFKPA
nr:unnamed protein product [Haemonchus contortus]